jgi:NADPH dehydrogenase (quinone)
MENNNTVHLINTHLTYPNWSEGTLNNSFVQAAKDFFSSKGWEILETKVEDGYNPDEEVEKHMAAGLVILQTPINWFGAPWIYKKYADEVFNSALFSQKFLSGDGRTREDSTRHYGTGGKMQGKKFMVCATWNAPEAAFGNPVQTLLQGKDTEDLLLNITSNYRFCGYDIVKSYNCFDIFKDGDIAGDLKQYPLYLEEIL